MKTRRLILFSVLAGGLAVCAAAEESVMNEKLNPETAKLEEATFANGCFWCAEAVFERVEGVKSVESGYTGGTIPQPTYKQVCTGRTGHAEAVRIEFDPKVVRYDELLDIFWQMHDPTTKDRQGADVGTQYRSAIFYHSDEQRAQADESKRKLAAGGKYRNPIVTEIVPAGVFYPAEVDHQDYYARNPNAPYCRLVIHPKLKKLGME